MSKPHKLSREEIARRLVEYEKKKLSEIKPQQDVQPKTKGR